MLIIKQSWDWVNKPTTPLEIIELAGRTCYKSEDKITPDSSQKFVSDLIKYGHDSVLEHVGASVKFITNRGVTHELVRHRLASYSQESTRYVNYGGKEMEFIIPVWLTEETYDAFKEMCQDSEYQYKRLMRKFNWRPEQAREVLPNSLKTEIIMTANLREWVHVFKLRTSKRAHPQIRALMTDCLENGFKKEIPIIFEGINTNV